MKPPSARPETFDDADLDDLFARARQPSEADAGAADRFLGHQLLTLPETPSPARAVPGRRLTGWRPVLKTVLAAAALLGGVLVLRPAPGADLTQLATQPLASSAAYDAYSSALGSGW